MTQETKREFVIALGVAPTSDAMFSAALPLLRPALLYADRVVIYSPSFLMATIISQIGDIERSDLLDLVAQWGSQLRPENADAFLKVRDAAGGLRRKRGKNRQEMLFLAQLNRSLDQAKNEMSQAMERLLEQYGVNEWMPAIDAGLVEVHSLGSDSSDSIDPDDLVNSWVHRLVELVTTPGAYPLLDDETGYLLQSLQSEGKFLPSTTLSDRARHAPTAKGLVERLPTFPQATVQEIVDVRHELTQSLGYFRSAVHRLATRMDSDPFDEQDVEAEVAEVWQHEVRPSLEALAQDIRDNRYVSQLAQISADHIGEILRTGTLLFGLTAVSDLSALLAPLGTAAEVAARAAVEKARTRKQLSKNQFMFLHQANIRLEDT